MVKGIDRMHHRRLKQLLLAQCLGLVVVIGVNQAAIACPGNQPAALSVSQPSRIQASMNHNQTNPGIPLDDSSGIYLISDRSESVVDFLQRHRVVVGGITLKEMGDLITQPELLRTNFFVSYPSFNDDGSGDRVTYGSPFKLAPLSPELVRLWQEKRGADGSFLQVFLMRDSHDPTLYHLVGWIADEYFSFSPELAKTNPLPASLNPRDLWYQGQ